MERCRRGGGDKMSRPSWRHPNREIELWRKRTNKKHKKTRRDRGHSKASHRSFKFCYVPEGAVKICSIYDPAT